MNDPIIDGVRLVSGDRILVTHQVKCTWWQRVLRRHSPVVQNGIYVVGSGIIIDSLTASYVVEREVP